MQPEFQAALSICFTRGFGYPWSPKGQKKEREGNRETSIHSAALCLANLSSKSVMQGRNCYIAFVEFSSTRYEQLM